jgi:ABC-type polysaccharide/polyol phosphate export permease
MQSTSSHTKHIHATAKNKFVIYMMLFSVSLSAVFALNKQFELGAPSLICLAMLPIIFFALACIELARSVRDDDEMFKKIIADAIQQTFMTMVVACLAIGLLQTLSVIPSFSLFYVFFAVCLMFVFSYARKARKYQ